MALPETRFRTGWPVGRRTRFTTGLLCGVLALFAVRLAVNRTAVADWLVAPLLVEDTDGSADAIVVMGAGAIGNCTPNRYGVRRVLLGARLWKEGRAPVVLFTGGQGDGPCPVATAMARLAMQIGVDASSVLEETAARSTHENAERSMSLLRAMDIERVLLVTDRLHMRRSAAAFASLGATVERASVPIFEGHEDNVDMLYAAARETAALLYYRMRGWTAAANGQAAANSLPVSSAAPERRLSLRHPEGPLVVLGASYARGWKITNFIGVPVVNRGVAGQQSADLLERFERDVVETRPRAVLIWGFINDLFRSERPDEAVNRIRDNYARMVDLAERHGIEPILATEVTVRPKDSMFETAASWVGRLAGKEAYQDRINRHVIDVNRWLLDLARQEGLLLLDLKSVLAEQDGRRRREFIQEDGSHITEAGYRALTTYATPVLQEHFRAR